MFENLTERLEGAFKILKGQGRITEINVAQSLKDVRRALIDADVNYKIAKEFTDEVKIQALGANVINAVSPGQLMIKIVHDELVKLMGIDKQDINLKGSPAVILLSGLQGSGKTTFAAKLAGHILKQGKSPLLVAGDVYRPAAIEQIKILGEQIKLPVFSDEGIKDPVKIAVNAIKHAKNNQQNVVIIDTAGRLSIDEDMMEEISNIKKAVNPGEILFVVDSMTGQDAVNTAKAFNDTLNFDGVVLTKLDGDTRGGAAISILKVVNKPIKFISIGEKLDAIDIFYPARMASRILGMGDIVSFVEKAQDVFDEKEAIKLQKKMRQSQFDFNDLLSQLRQIKKMGNIKDLMGMIPGMNKVMKDQELDDDSFKHVEAIIFSMTARERKHPEMLNGFKRKRIANGSGTTIQQVNQLVKQLEDMRKIMKKMNKPGLKGKMAAQMPFKR
ncbi:MAG: signal recognition particle protein [Bacteroidetes bacterium]|nr:signal recognition particle protein [Bacteroidota bacterium]MBL6964307.1 signal recognition particle protein [Bacteroidota bacterium]